MSNNKNKSLSIIFILFYSMLLVTTSFAQGLCDVYDFRFNKIQGKVLSDGPNGDEPIPNARIELRRNDKVIKTVFSDKDGFFDIGKVKNGKYLLAVSQEELRFVDFFAGVTVTKKTIEKERNLFIKLGVSVVKPCGGGKAWLDKIS